MSVASGHPTDADRSHRAATSPRSAKLFFDSRPRVATASGGTVHRSSPRVGALVLLPWLIAAGCGVDSAPDAPADVTPGADAQPVDGGSATPTLDGGSTAPALDGSPAPGLDGGSTAPGLDGGSTAPALDRGSTDPIDHGAPTDATPDQAALADAAAEADATPADARPPDAAPHPIPPAPVDGPPAWYDVEILARFPHDPAAFTQGLVYDGGLLYESTGLRGESTVRIVRLETGAILRRHDLAARFFGEGLARVGDRLVQLTWQSGEGFVYDRATLAPIDRFGYAGEGWGLAFDGARLVMSDGTARLRFLDPDSYAEIGEVTVRDEGRPVERLNELEVIDGEVFANVWFTDLIARIDPRDGRVAGWIDLSAIRPPEVRDGDVLNGIAWDAAGRRLLVTGKRWPVIYAVRLVPR